MRKIKNLIKFLIKAFRIMTYKILYVPQYIYKYFQKARQLFQTYKIEENMNDSKKIKFVYVILLKQYPFPMLYCQSF